MSRIGNKIIKIPQGVQISVEDAKVTVKGPKGEVKQDIFEKLDVNQKDDELIIVRHSDDKDTKAQHGLARALIANMVEGVSKGFEKKLEIQGVGYKAAKQGKTLVLNLGFSNPVKMEDPEGIATEVPGEREIVVKGIDKTLVGQHAANIRSHRKPEPYKGKGIRYEGEYVRRKEGKAGATE